jgi:acetyltransferase-like isoleucine patch superfamily enzyme
MIGILKHLYRIRKSENLRNSLMKKFAPCRIGIGLVVTIVDELKFGKYVDIQTNCYIASNGGVSIGDYTQISENCTIFSDEHLYDIGDYLPISNKKIKKTVTIEDFVIIGANVSILPGVTIGRGSIVGMGAVVVSSIPPYSIALGNPARVIKKRDEEEFNKLLKEKKFFQNIEGDLDYEHTK